MKRTQLLSSTYIFLTLAAALVFCVPSVYAYTIDTVDVSNVTTKDFMVTPSKVETTVNPGEQKTTTMTVTNRLGDTRTFKIEIEDVAGSKNPQQTVVLLGDDRGPYSLKNYLHVPEYTFTLKHGERATIPVTISVPSDAEQGGLYGSVLVSALPSASHAAGASVVSRTGALFFVTVPGSAQPQAKLVSIEKSSGGFRLLFSNDGSLHVNPYGKISIKNMFGHEVGSLAIDPWFSLPHSLRSRDVSWTPHFLFGYYTAEAQVNRGYDNVIDTASVSFWAIPWSWLIGALVFIAAAVFGFRTSRKKMLLVAVPMLALFIVATNASLGFAAVMTGSSYKIESDSINFSGGRSVSSSYRAESTVGEVGSGQSSSADYILRGGYQQMETSFISVSGGADVTMTPALDGTVGGTSDGSTAVTVTTDNSAGYELSIKADTSPAMQGVAHGGSIADYAPAGANPDFDFAVSANDARFGFSPEGTDIVQKYKDDGVSCNAGVSDTASACWNGLSTTNELIDQTAAANYPAGSETTFRFRTALGSAHTTPADTYTAMTVLTTLAL